MKLRKNARSYVPEKLEGIDDVFGLGSSEEEDDDVSYDTPKGLKKADLPQREEGESGNDFTKATTSKKRLHSEIDDNPSEFSWLQQQKRLKTSCDDPTMK
jgi:hypothetical protein